MDKEGKSAYWIAQELGYQRICEALYPGANVVQQQQQEEEEEQSYA